MWNEQQQKIRYDVVDNLELANWEASLHTPLTPVEPDTDVSALLITRY